jgi:tetratricopeptide (TPR) repeat protein
MPPTGTEAIDKTLSLYCSVAYLLLLLLFASEGSLVERSQRARQALLDGHAAEAVKLYRNLVKDLPNDVRMRLNLALALESAGDTSQESDQLRLIVKQSPSLAPAWLMLGLAERKLGHQMEAIKALRKAMTLDPGNDTALLELGDAYLASGRPAEALEQFRKLAASKPQSAKPWQGMGMSYAALASAEATKLAAYAPGSARTLVLAAYEQFDRERYAQAFALFHEAGEKEPQLREAHEGIAAVYEHTGHPDWAALERAKVPGTDCKGLSVECLFRQGKFEAAIQVKAQAPEDRFWVTCAYRQLAQQAFAHLSELPESAELHELLAGRNQQQGRRTEAIAEWRRARALAPHDRRIAARLAESLWLARSYEEALDLMKPLAAASPGDAQLQYILGDTLFRLQQPEAAIPRLEAAVRLQPALLAAHAALGSAYLQMGEPQKAIPHLEKGLATDESAILFQLGQAYRATGQTTLADHAFARQRELLRTQPSEPARLEITPPQ